mmetsp:Transcript_20129/g.50965  ORF Transcript_20129/g.50965 Transcript_20129/m.50965 type:complete len:222 (+) Transcript_20129:241-906(+)
MPTSAKVAPFCAICRQSSVLSSHMEASTSHVTSCSFSPVAESSTSMSATSPPATRSRSRPDSVSVSVAMVESAFTLVSVEGDLSAASSGSSSSTRSSISRYSSYLRTAASSRAMTPCVAAEVPSRCLLSSSGSLSVSSDLTTPFVANCGSIEAQSASTLAPCCHCASESERSSATCLDTHTGSPRSTWSKHTSHTRTGSVYPMLGMRAVFLHTSATKIWPQ